jgi:hypothetical protein
VRISLIVEGELSTFTDNVVTAIQAEFAALAGVHVSDVVVRVASGSVIITVEISVSNSVSADNMRDSLASSNELASAAAASTFLSAIPGVSDVEVVSEPSISSVTEMDDGLPLGLSEDEDRSLIDIGTVAGAALAIAVLVVLLVCWRLRKFRQVSKADARTKINPNESSTNERSTNESSTSSTGVELETALPTIAAVPTIAADGLLAVLDHKQITPFDLKNDITCGAELGLGTFGKVMQCSLRQTNCAIKQLHKDDKRSEFMLQGLLDEFEIMKSLRHPNVLLTMGIAVDREELTTGIVMELMQASLMDVIYHPSFAPHATWEKGLISIACDVAKGMSYIHFNGLLHRDLKPGNVLLDSHWIAQVADFGTAIDD